MKIIKKTVILQHFKQAVFNQIPSTYLCLCWLFDLYKKRDIFINKTKPADAYKS